MERRTYLSTERRAELREAAEIYGRGGIRPWALVVLLGLVLSSAIALIWWWLALADFVLSQGLGGIAYAVGFLIYPVYGMLPGPFGLGGILLIASSYWLLRVRLWAWWVTFGATLAVFLSLALIWVSQVIDPFNGGFFEYDPGAPLAWVITLVVAATAVYLGALGPAYRDVSNQRRSQLTKQSTSGR